MAISFVAASAVATGGNTGTAAVSCTPGLPAGTAVGDRVFVCTVGTAAANAVNSGWTRVLSVSLGTGTLGAGTGQRIVTVDYRDYDGVWTMPSFGQVSRAAPTIVGAAVAYRKGALETWNAPTSTSGSDTATAATSFSATGAANLSATVGNLLLAVAGTPANVTTTAGAITAAGATLGTVSERVDGGFATGNDVLHVFDALVTGGTSTATPVNTATVSTSGSSSGGTVFVRQTVTLPPVSSLTDNFATADAAKWTYSAGASVSSGQLVEAVNAGYTGNIASTTFYDLTGSALIVELVQRANVGTGTTETYVSLYTNAAVPNDNAVLFDVTGVNLVAYSNVANVRTQVASAAYNATAHRWLRIRESGGTVSWDASPDGATWTNLGSWVATFSLASLLVQLGAGYFGTESSPGTAIWDNVNLPPSITAVPVSDTGTAVDAASVAASVPGADTAATADALTAAAATPLPDTAAAADVFSVTASVVLADTATTADALTTAKFTAVTVTDTGTVVDAVTAASSTPLTDTATAVDAATVAARIPAADTAAATDATAVTAAAPGSDTGSGADQLATAVSAPLPDTAAGADALEVAVSAALDEEAAAADGLVVDVELPLGDAASAGDDITISVQLVLTDSATGTDRVDGGEPVLGQVTQPITAAFLDDGTFAAAFTDGGAGVATFAHAPVFLAVFTQTGTGAAQFASTGISVAAFSTDGASAATFTSDGVGAGTFA